MYVRITLKSLLMTAFFRTIGETAATCSLSESVRPASGGIGDLVDVVSSGLIHLHLAPAHRYLYVSAIG